MRSYTIDPSESTFEELCAMELKIHRQWRRREELLPNDLRQGRRREAPLTKQLDAVEMKLRVKILMYLPYVASAVVGGKNDTFLTPEERGRRYTFAAISVALELAWTGHSHFLLKRVASGKGKSASSIEEQAKLIAVRYITEARAQRWIDESPLERVATSYGVDVRTVQRWCATYGRLVPATRRSNEYPTERISHDFERDIYRREKRMILAKGATHYREAVDSEG